MKSKFFERFSNHLRSHPESLAMQGITEDGKESFSYRDVSEEVLRISRHLQKSGIGPGDTVGILLENHPRWGIAFLSAFSAGAIVVPFDVLHEEEVLAELLLHSGCKYVISSQKFLPKLQAIQARLPHPLPGLLIGGQEAGYSQWDEVLKEGEPAPKLPLVQKDPDEPFLIIYTSGTTGNPKGVVLSERSVFRNVEELLKIVETSSQDHMLSVLPLYHVLALIINFLTPLWLGAKVTFLDVLEASRILQTFREEGITIFVCVPQFFYLVHRRILQEAGKQSWIKRFLFFRLLALSRFCNRRLGFNPGKSFFRSIHAKFGSHFRLFGAGGARFDPEVVETFRDLGFTLIQAYGMTETAALVTVNRPGGSGVGSVGLPLPTTELRISRPGEDGIGEILVRGENVMKGYLKNPAETRQVMKDGWLYTGDLGYEDAEGHLYITGRKKEVIVLSSGKNIYPEEVEDFYQKHCRYIKEMCVVGLPDTFSPQEQEKLHAVIVPDFELLRSEGIANAADMIRYMTETVSQRLPSYKRFKSFEIRNEPLPRTTTRKIRRFELERDLARRLSSPETTPEVEETPAKGEVETRLFALLKDFKGGTSIRREMNLEIDLGFDSLQRVEFLSNVEESFGIHISDEEASKILTVQDLVRFIESREFPESQNAESPKRSWSEFLSEPLQTEEVRKLRQILSPRPLCELALFGGSRLLRLFFLVFFRLKIQGRPHLPDQYPFLLCPNHLSFLDVFVLVSVLPFRVVRRLFFLGYSDYFQGPILGRLGRLAKVVPVDSDRNLRQALRLGGEGLRSGLVLCVFPEGERSIDGTLKRFRKGPAILAGVLRTPLVPVGIVGTFEAWPRGSNRIRLHPLQVRFGRPLLIGDEESDDIVNTRLRTAVQELLDEEGDGMVLETEPK